MNHLFKCFLFFLSININGQSLPNNFHIGDYVQVFDNDSILVYFNCTGTVVEKKCADFYRKGRADSTNINFIGEFKDYFISGSIALSANISDNNLNGDATYYYENGMIKSKGRYLNDLKTGIWTYYYDNGQKEKVINFIDTCFYINEYYKSTGKQKVINGSGTFRGEFYPFLGCFPFAIWGKVMDGKMNGKWNIATIGYEYFNNGQFIKGISYGNKYTDFQTILINGFCSNENLHLEENMQGCPGDDGIFRLGYKEASFHETFYHEVIETFISRHNTNIKNQWIIVGLKINEMSELVDVNVKSSIDDASIEKELYNIITSMRGFSSAKMNGENIDFDLFFTILIKDNQLIIPTDYNYKNRNTMPNILLRQKQIFN